MTAGKTTYEKSKRILENLPDYIGDFFVSKSASGLSSLTLYEYLKEYKRFFTWFNQTFRGLMIDQKIYRQKSLKISLKKTLKPILVLLED